MKNYNVTFFKYDTEKEVYNKVGSIVISDFGVDNTEDPMNSYSLAAKAFRHVQDPKCQNAQKLSIERCK